MAKYGEYGLNERRMQIIADLVAVPGAHGYELLERTNDDLPHWYNEPHKAANLYRDLRELEEEGLIQRSDPTESDPRIVGYDVTEIGKTAASEYCRTMMEKPIEIYRKIKRD